MITLKKVTAFAFCLLLFNGIAYSQKSTKVEALENRVKNLEDYRANLDQLYTIKAEKLKSHMDDQISTSIKNVEKINEFIEWLPYIGSFSIIGLILGYIWVIRKTKNLILEKIENIVERKREELIKLIETQEFDSRLRKNKKLLVLSTNQGVQEKAKALLDKLKFQKIKYRVVTQYTQLTDEFDLIIFNDSDASFSQELIDEYIANITDEDLCFVAYTTKKLTPNSRVNFSNSSFTLYHSILSTLKYAEILKITHE